MTVAAAPAQGHAYRRPLPGERFAYGGLSCVISAVITNPVDVVKIRQEAAGQSCRQALVCSGTDGLSATTAWVAGTCPPLLTALLTFLVRHGTSVQNASVQRGCGSGSRREWRLRGDGAACPTPRPHRHPGRHCPRRGLGRSDARGDALDAAGSDIQVGCSRAAARTLHIWWYLQSACKCRPASGLSAKSRLFAHCLAGSNHPHNAARYATARTSPSSRC